MFIESIFFALDKIPEGQHDCNVFHREYDIYLFRPCKLNSVNFGGAVTHYT